MLGIIVWIILLVVIGICLTPWWWFFVFAIAGFLWGLHDATKNYR